MILTDGNNEFYDLPDGSGGNPTKPSDFTAYGRVNAPGPVGLNKTTTGAGVTDPQHPHARDLRGDEGARGTPKVSLLDHLQAGTPPNTTPVISIRPARRRRRCTTTRRTTRRSSAAFKAIGGQLANLRIVE